MKKLESISSICKELAILVAVAVFVAFLVGFDQYCKYLALVNLVPGVVVSVVSLPFLGDICILTLVWNTGAFLSLGAGSEGILRGLFMIGVPAVALAGMVLYLVRPFLAALFKKKIATVSGELRIGLALFIAGGGGNLIDRIRDGRVVDFLNFGIASLRTGIMNVADLYIALGLVFLVVYYFRHRTRASSGDAPQGQH